MCVYTKHILYICRQYIELFNTMTRADCTPLIVGHLVPEITVISDR